jgi:hypothetical protein
MRLILQGWNLMRILRLVLAIAILVQGIITKDAVSIILGLIVGGMAITNTGCCGSSGCEVKSTGTNKTNRIHYEELDHKK